MSDKEMPHEGHENHLCALHGDGLLKDNPKRGKNWYPTDSFFAVAVAV